MENASFGTGSSLLGGTSALAQALARRGGVGQDGMQSQSSPASAIYNPSQQTPAPAPMPNQSPMSNLPQQAFQAQPQPLQAPAQQAFNQQPKMSPTEAEKILEALSGHLKHLQKSDMMKLEATMPPQPTGGL